MTVNEIVKDFWDTIREIEIDDSWREGRSDEFYEYRRKFELAQKRELVADFPLSLEIEASYYCNLTCPNCPRTAGAGERLNKHMPVDVWGALISECAEHKLPSILMDHEAESLMNPRFFQMLEDAKKAGILDIWLHTNGNLLTREKSERLIDSGLNRINFSIDAATAATYDIVRPGGKFEKVLKNINEFLELKIKKDAKHLRVRISFIEQEANIAEKEQFFHMWKDVPGVNMITFQECWDFSAFGERDADADLSPDALRAKFAQDEPFHCSIPWEMPVIDVEGNVNPCGSPVREHNKDFTLGSIANGDSLASCWTGSKMTALRDLHTRGEWFLNPMCRVCVQSQRASRSKLRTANARYENGQLRTT